MRWVVLALAGCDERDPAAPAGSAACDLAGVICTWMGLPGLAMQGPEEVPRGQSGLYLPQDVVLAPDGTAYVADFNNHRIREIATDGTVITVAGTGMPGDGELGQSCWDGCGAVDYEMWHPSHLALDPDDPDVVYAAAWHNHRVDRVNLRRDRLTWVAGDGSAGFREGDASSVRLSLPSSVVSAEDGSLYVSDQGNQLIRRIAPGGAVETVAGTPGLFGYAGDGGPAVDAVLHGHGDWVGGPCSKLDLRGHELLVADTMNSVVRRIDLDTGVIERFAGRFESMGRGFVTNPLDGTVHYAELGGVVGYDGDGGPALDAQLNRPRDVAFGPDGEVYIADSANHCVRVVLPDGTIETFAGTCGVSGYGGDEGPADEGLLDLPAGVSVDARGNVYVADANNHLIRRVASGH